MPPPPGRHKLIFPVDCVTGPRRGYWIKHLIAPGDVVAIVGQPSSGKSMLAPYLAYAVAQGRRVFGLRTKPGRVLYVAAEDATGMRQRIHALLLRHGDAPAFAMIACGNLRETGEKTELLGTVADFNPALVVIDTLGAAFAGMDENSSQDMGAVVALAREFAGDSRAVILVHHIAKHGDGTPRGHSALNGTLDMSLRLESKDEEGVIRGFLLKNRNGTTETRIAFRMEVVVLGEDEDGEAITAPVATELAEGDIPTRAGKLPSVARASLAVLRQLATASPDSGGRIAEIAWREHCDNARTVSASEKPDSRRRAFRRAFTELIAAGAVVAGEGCVWEPSLAPEFDADIAGQTDNSTITKNGQNRTDTD